MRETDEEKEYRRQWQKAKAERARGRDIGFYFMVSFFPCILLGVFLGGRWPSALSLIILAPILWIIGLLISIANREPEDE